VHVFLGVERVEELVKLGEELDEALGGRGNKTLEIGTDDLKGGRKE
jgi:hypothetical protein